MHGGFFLFMDTVNGTYVNHELLLQSTLPGTVLFLME